MGRVVAYNGTKPYAGEIYKFDPTRSDLHGHILGPHRVEYTCTSNHVMNIVCFRQHSQLWTVVFIKRCIPKCQCKMRYNHHFVLIWSSVWPQKITHLQKYAKQRIRTTNMHLWWTMRSVMRYTDQPQNTTQVYLSNITVEEEYISHSIDVPKAAISVGSFILSGFY